MDHLCQIVLSWIILNSRCLATESTRRICQLTKSEPFNDRPQNEQLRTAKDMRI